MIRFLSRATLFVLVLSALMGRDAVLAGPDIKQTEKYIKDLKTSKDAKVRAVALDELGKIGQIQKSLITPAWELIIQALADKDVNVRAAAARTYGMIDPEPKEAVPALLKLLKEDKSDVVKLGAIQGLAAMGPSAKDANKTLRELARDKNKKDKKSMQLSRAAQMALRQINVKKP